MGSYRNSFYFYKDDGLKIKDNALLLLNESQDETLRVLNQKMSKT